MEGVDKFTDFNLICLKKTSICFLSVSDLLIIKIIRELTLVLTAENTSDANANKNF